MIHVIIVEDDPMVLEVNKGFLDKHPLFTLVGCAKSGEAAQKMIEEKKPNLVLLDVYLPDMSGMEVLRKIRTREIPTDVIMVTAAKDVKTVHEFFRYGAVDYIVKPFRYERFKQALQTYIKMWKKINQSESISQEDIDEWTSRVEKESEPLPKGISEVTLKQVMMAVFEEKNPVTAEQLASKLGMARVTVRRYLDYLERTKRIRKRVEYGRIGRPSNYYFV